MGRGYFVAVTGSTWPLQGLSGNYGVYVPPFFAKNCFEWLLREAVNTAIEEVGDILVYFLFMLGQRKGPCTKKASNK